jgi:DNA-binding response OmpR family regulator
MQDISKATSPDPRQSPRLLIVDDDAYLRVSLRQQFMAEGFHNIFDIGSASGLDMALTKADPDLILLDIQMPDGNGIDLCRRMRSNGFAKPILMLTAKNAESDIIAGLEAGANDYITKPLRMGELLARISAQLRQFKASDDARFQLAGLSFVPTNKMLHDTASGRMQALTEKETTILKFLYRAFPEPVTKDEILAEVWGLQNGLTTHTLETHIYRLRQKISRFTKTPLIVTTENGYRLNL